jgi:hypothetical protein
MYYYGGKGGNKKVTAILHATRGNNTYNSFPDLGLIMISEFPKFQKQLKCYNSIIWNRFDIGRSLQYCSSKIILQ